MLLHISLIYIALGFQIAFHLLDEMRMGSPNMKYFVLLRICLGYCAIAISIAV